MPDRPIDRPPIRVALCDDSAAIRSALGRLLEEQPGIAVVARLGDGGAAIDAVTRCRGAAPIEVLLLDLDMPVIDGMTALPRLLRADPALRIIVVSSLTLAGAEVALSALRAGAADYIAKPGTTGAADFAGGLAGFRTELVAKVRGQGRLRRQEALRREAASGTAAAAPVRLARPALLSARPPALLAIGASTGGPQALFRLIRDLGPVPVPVVITQHMPAIFTAILARHIDQLAVMPCAEARDGERLRPGTIALAPGDRHLLVERAEAGLQARLDAGPPEHFCRPAVDPMLRSAAAACDGPVLAVLLTGMGQDGLAGTGAVVAAGGLAVAQDQASSVVWGMPGAIARAGLCRAVLPLSEIAVYLRGLLLPVPA